MMGERRLVIEPLTRIEGQARITIHRAANGRVQEARLQVLGTRGFEHFCLGRPFTDMPGLTARICGICPVSHQLAAASAGDQLLGVEPPPAARRLRLLLALAQITQSHALSFFHLSSPDLLLGWDAPAQQRHLFGVLAADPELARAGIRLRQFGQRAIEAIAGRSIHGAWAVPGGGLNPLAEAGAVSIRVGLVEAKAAARLGLERYKQLLDGPSLKEVFEVACFESLHLAMVSPQGDWCVQGGTLRLIAADGTIVADQIQACDYDRLLAEAEEPWSSMSFPYVRALGYPSGMYRVGPLARLNVCERFGSSWADRELAEYRQRYGRIVQNSFASHHARLIEIVACLEALEATLEDPQLLDHQVRHRARLNQHEAVGMGEAPRGTLFHHYRVDANGLLVHVNLLVATGQNNLAMNRTITALAQRFLDRSDDGPAEDERAANRRTDDRRAGDASTEHQSIPEGLLNRIEAGIRAFDPCLSCATHAAGQMALQVQLFDHRGTLLAERSR